MTANSGLSYEYIKMVASTDIKFFVHTNNSAPQLTNNFGCMLNVLDAALINGIQVGTVSSLTASGKIVTAVFGTAHNLMQYQVIKIAGANQAEFNVEARILTVPNATTITFELAVVPSVATATGTINCSLPPLGWEKPFSSTSATGGKGAYRSTNLLLPSRPFLRVVDELDPVWTSTYAKYAKVGIVEDMTDIDTMLGVQAPYASANIDKNWLGSGSGATAKNGWAKWYYAHNASFASSNSQSDTSATSSGNRRWILVGNADYFYILPTNHSTDVYFSPYGFGAFKSLINNDMSNTFLSSLFNDPISTYKAGYIPLNSSTTNQKILLQRGYAQNAAYAEAIARSLRPLPSSTDEIRTGADNYIGSFSLTGIAPFAPVFINEVVLRGEMPGIYWLFQKTPFFNFQLIEQNSSVYVAVNCATAVDGSIPLATGQIILKVGDL